MHDQLKCHGRRRSPSRPTPTHFLARQQSLWPCRPRKVFVDLRPADECGSRPFSRGGVARRSLIMPITNQNSQIGNRKCGNSDSILLSPNTCGSLRANKSSSENVPHECHLFLPVKRSPHFGHVQSGLRFLTADFADCADRMFHSAVSN